MVLALAQASLTEGERIDVALSKERIRRRGFKQFIVEAWPVIEPATPFIPGFHIDAIAEHIEALFKNELTQLLINIAPRHSKTSLVSILAHAYCWTLTPHKKFLCASYGQDLANQANRKARMLIESDWYQYRWGDLVTLSDDENRIMQFSNTKHGMRKSVGVGGASTGIGGDFVFIDDLHKADDAHSDAKREAALRYFDETLSTRLNNRSQGGMVVVGQRIHENDITGHLLEQGDWVHLNLPTEYEKSSHCITQWITKEGKKRAWHDPRKNDGELLCPARVNAEEINKLKRSMGVLGYAAQYQQRPIPAGGYEFKRENERVFSISDDSETFLLETPTWGVVYPVLKSTCDIFQTMDLAISEKQTADYTVIATWAKTAHRDLLLLDIVRGHWSHEEQQQQAKLAFLRHRPDVVYVEAVAYQMSMIQDLLLFSFIRCHMRFT